MGEHGDTFSRGHVDGSGALAASKRGVPMWLRQEVRRFLRLSWRHRLWAVENWWKGYRFGPIQRCRWCDHTTPYHYRTCRTVLLAEVERHAPPGSPPARHKTASIGSEERDQTGVQGGS